MKPFLSVWLATIGLATSLYGAAYTTNFNSYALYSDPAGQDGWTINDSTDQYAAINRANADPLNPGITSRALQLGDASLVTYQPVGPSVVLSHAYTGTVGATNLTFDFIINDSATGSFQNRDIFGTSISNGSGGNLLSISFVPVSQSTDPDNDPYARWNLYYTLGTGATVPLNLSVYKNTQYYFNLGFNPNASNPALSDFLLSITSQTNTLHDGATGLSLAPSAATGNLNISWSKDSGAAFGSNSLVVDNLSVVPEPSSTLLICLAGLGFVSRRKRA